MKCNYCGKPITERLGGALYCSERCRSRKRAWSSAYTKSEKGKATIKRFWQSSKGKACSRRAMNKVRDQTAIKTVMHDTQKLEYLSTPRELSSYFINRCWIDRYPSITELEQAIEGFCNMVGKDEDHRQETSDKIRESRFYQRFMDTHE